MINTFHRAARLTSVAFSEDAWWTRHSPRVHTQNVLVRLQRKSVKELIDVSSKAMSAGPQEILSVRLQESEETVE